LLAEASGKLVVLDPLKAFKEPTYFWNAYQAALQRQQNFQLEAWRQEQAQHQALILQVAQQKITSLQRREACPELTALSPLVQSEVYAVIQQLLPYTLPLEPEPSETSLILEEPDQEAPVTKRPFWPSCSFRRSTRVQSTAMKQWEEEDILEAQARSLAELKLAAIAPTSTPLPVPVPSAASSVSASVLSAGLPPRVARKDRKRRNHRVRARRVVELDPLLTDDQPNNLVVGMDME
jgi:hypothetical protein